MLNFFGHAEIGDSYVRVQGLEMLTPSHYRYPPVGIPPIYTGGTPYHTTH